MVSTTWRCRLAARVPQETRIEIVLLNNKELHLSGTDCIDDEPGGDVGVETSRNRAHDRVALECGTQKAKYCCMLCASFSDSSRIRASKGCASGDIGFLRSEKHDGRGPGSSVHYERANLCPSWSG